MSKAPAFQFYVKDWLSSANVQLMTPAQEGGYIRLLAYCWDSGDCSLPDDDDELATLSRLGEGWLNGGSRLVRKCFAPHPVKPGYLTNTKMLEQAEKHIAWLNKSAEGGRRSAAKRAENKQHSKAGSTVVDKCLQPNGNSSSASSSAIRVSKDTNPISPLPEWLPDDLWKAFVEMRKKKRNPMTDRAMELIIRDLDKFRHGGEDIRKILEKSIVGGWAGVFSLKDSRTTSQQKGTTHGKHTGFEELDYREGTDGFIVS